MKIVFKSAILIFAMMLGGCAAYRPHPGSPNLFDSHAYDSLIVTHSVIETTKSDLASNSFPVSITGDVKTALNGLIQAYNAADTAYQAYHTAALAGTATAAQQAAVSDSLDKVSTATGVLSLAKVKP